MDVNLHVNLKTQFQPLDIHRIPGLHETDHHNICSGTSSVNVPNEFHLANSELWNRSWEGSWDGIIKLKKIKDIVCKIILSSSASICEDLWSFGSLCATNMSKRAWKSSKVFWTKKSFTPRTSSSPLSPRQWSHWPPSLSCPIQHVVWILVPSSSQRTRDGEVSQAALARKLINGYKIKKL